MKWFTNVHNMDELKATYRELVKKHHPDCGGNVADMQEINVEYDKLVERFSRSENDFTDDQHNAAEEAEAYRDIINALINFPGLQIEICGCWIWVSGNTYAAREILKQQGFSWANKKKMWYWHRPEDTIGKHRTATMEQIRSKYGSEVERLHRLKQ